MKKLVISLFVIVIIGFLSSKVYSEMKPYDGPKFDLISYRLKDDKSKIPGSGYVQRKSDPVSALTEKLVLKGMKYIEKLGVEKTISLINSKPRKFRDFKTYLFIIDLNGNVLAHSGNPNFAGRNMLSIKDSRGHLFIQEYVNNIQQYDGINYMNLLTLANDTQIIYNFVYLERLDDNLIIGAVAKP